jgi:Cytochrome P460
MAHWREASCVACFIDPEKGATMKGNRRLIGVGIMVAASVLAAGAAIAAQDKYSLKVPNGLAFSEFTGYESWQTISVSHGGLLAVILGNPAMIEAFKAGYPGNGKPFPDGVKMAKIHWTPKKNEAEPGQPSVPGPLHDVDFMVKDSKRFADSGGWGYGAFEYDAASETFRPGTVEDHPPQANDAKCGFACHTIVKTRDYVFTEYQKR